MTESTAPKSIVEYMAMPNVQDNLNKTLKERSHQFVASVAALVNSNPKIAACEKKSVLSSCLIAASLDLPINQNLGFAYIIPYKVKIKGTQVDEKTGREMTAERFEDQAQFQMGWKGFVQLAIRTGKYKSVNVREVREGEFLGEDFLSGEMSFQWKQDRESLPVVGYVAYFKLITGFEKMLYMTVDQLRKHGQRYSKSYKYGPWTEDPDAMMRKTVLKLLISKFGPMTASLAQAIESDQAIVSDDKTRYVDNERIKPEDEADAREIIRIKNFITSSRTMDKLLECEEAVDGSMDDELIELFVAKKKQLEKVEA